MSYPVRRRRDFASKLAAHGFDLTPVSIRTLQLNITSLCNQACKHCHVGASPARKEQMCERVADRCLDILAAHPHIEVVDITGGAPELNPCFERLVMEARRMGRKVKARHNLTVTFDGDPRTGEGKTHLPEFFASHSVELIASLPHYTADVVDRQRGAGAFARSIRGLRILNQLGYGQGGGLVIILAYNPAGASLPDQAGLEEDFRENLLSRFGLRFDRLYAFNNVPVNRFRDALLRSFRHDDYLDMLARSFNPETAARVMCRSLVSVGPDGRVYDCDFNQALGMQARTPAPVTVFNFSYQDLLERRIRVGPHCFACTAGAGSG